MMHHPYVVTVSSEKGGVGKTTLATNLAIYLKALHEDLPVTLFSFDNHFSVDRMFRIGSGQARGTVADLFSGGKVDDLVETGQYGVQFIASCRELEALGRGIEDVSRLAGTLGTAGLQGMIIIDTRPSLDIFTRNAIYAADRVIIPVKDAPSLENCRHIYDFCEKQGISKGTLRLLPCLIDSRIRYEGPFKDAYQLLKAYAINRGYRCLEGFIAKSPKVEALNTNPEGKIYPVLTHGRETNVHLQFSHLARQILLGAKDCPEPRIAKVRQGLLEQQTTREEAHQALRSRLSGGCLICGKPLADTGAKTPAAFYCESSDNRTAGFLEEECFSGLIFRHFYRSQKEITPTDPVRTLFRESAQRSYFALRPVPKDGGLDPSRLAFYRFDDQSREISHRIIELKEFRSRFLFRERTSLYRLAAETLLDDTGAPTGNFLLVRRIEPGGSEGVLVGEPRRQFEQTMSRVADRWSE
jgi:cellulose biosynthesis protein BcsQ